MNHQKYKTYQPLSIPDRKWPSNQVKHAPIWCSVDLRDGNQSLEKPMDLYQKINFFEYLVKLGFKQIEVGFPAASDTEYLFTRTLIEQNLIPDDVTIQVLTQSRAHIIEKTFEALQGVNKAVVHLYNSTSTLQRDVVFGKSKKEIIDLAIYGARMVYDLAGEYGRERFRFEYSPESFTGTEMDYAVEICNAVIAEWNASPTHPVIINLPSTVEMSMPNIYADQIEYMGNHLNNRESVIISLHAHNDRGTAVAATELGLLAGADRVEGTLFGNGERTGNADIMNIALNLFSQGIDPMLDFSNILQTIEIYQDSTGIQVGPRHPYAGDLVYTAFSGSHQDAIKKGLAKRKEGATYWEVPYLPIDPMDVGRSYEPIIRINSQSGKGGVFYLLETNYGIKASKSMQQHFGKIVTNVSDEQNKELMAEDIYTLFKSSYINIESTVKLIRYSETSTDEIVDIVADVEINGQPKTLTGNGNGLLDAFCKALQSEFEGTSFEIIDYNEHSLDYGSKSRAITYVQLYDKNQNSFFGAGVSSSISKSSLKAVVSAFNALLKA